MDPADGHAAPPLTDARASADEALAALTADARRYEFDQALVRLARALGDRAVREGRVRVRPRTDTSFPVSDVDRVTIGDDGRVEVEVTFGGLYGPGAALPRYLSEAADREEGAALRDFLDVFHPRLYALYHEAWRKYRLRYRFRAGEGGEPLADEADVAPFTAFTGGGGPGVPLTPLQLAALGGRLSMRVRNASGLRDLLGVFLGHDVSVSENEPRWVPLPRRGRLGARGGDGFELGAGALLGGRLYDVSGKVRVVVGPLDYPDFQTLLPGGPRAGLLAGLVRYYLPDGLDFDVELLLRERQARSLVLGDGVSRLGRNAWVGSTGPGVVSEIVSYN